MSSKLDMYEYCYYLYENYCIGLHAPYTRYNYCLFHNLTPKLLLMYNESNCTCC